MKKKEIILAAAILLAALMLWAILQLIQRPAGSVLRITVGNELYGEYDLNQDQIIEIGDTNVCEIKNGAVRMIQADCPDHLCMDSDAITREGGTIVCLPNRVILETGTEDTSSMPDAVSS
ncbi:MAG: NusG domain II-containing protein [Ruminococcus sp.]|jgi:hypothetical protein